MTVSCFAQSNSISNEISKERAILIMVFQIKERTLVVTGLFMFKLYFICCPSIKEKV